MSVQGSNENNKVQESTEQQQQQQQQQQPSEEYKPVVFPLDQLDSYTATDPVTKEVWLLFIAVHWEGQSNLLYHQCIYSYGQGSLYKLVMVNQRITTV